MPKSKLHKKTKTKKLKNLPIGYVEKFYRHLAQNIAISVNQYFYGNDAEIPSEDVQKYLLATSDFAKAEQDDINLYVSLDRVNNASFRQKLGPIAKISFVGKIH